MNCLLKIDIICKVVKSSINLEGVYMKNNKHLVEIWGDVVEIKALVLSISISVVSTMGMYFLAPSGDRTKGLFFGLAGAVLGFIISAVIIKPKRDITIEDKK